ncbi:MAG: hypothetical protein Q8P02_05020, partial [Candidatus Micrarchaeota archaeon]|nr:hypothetical protein [Candidatus Micrarchaeota archaeon]
LGALPPAGAFMRKTGQYLLSAMLGWTTPLFESQPSGNRQTPALVAAYFILAVAGVVLVVVPPDQLHLTLGPTAVSYLENMLQVALLFLPMAALFAGIVLVLFAGWNRWVAKPYLGKDNLESDKNDKAVAWGYFYGVQFAGILLLFPVYYAATEWLGAHGQAAFGAYLVVSRLFPGAFAWLTRRRKGKAKRKTKAPDIRALIEKMG